MSTEKAAGTAEGLDTPGSTAETAGEAEASDPVVVPSAEESTTEIAKRVRNRLHAAKSVLHRIIENEMPYRGGDNDG